jgi:hypothetical protein
MFLTSSYPVHFFKYCDMTPESRNSEVRIDDFTRQRLGKYIPAATNTHATIE